MSYKYCSTSAAAAHSSLHDPIQLFPTTLPQSLLICPSQMYVNFLQECNQILLLKYFLISVQTEQFLTP